jgi:hypothetical protein
VNSKMPPSSTERRNRQAKLSKEILPLGHGLQAIIALGGQAGSSVTLIGLAPEATFGYIRSWFIGIEVSFRRATVASYLPT